MNELRKIWSRILGIEKRLKDGDEIIIVDALPTHPVEGVFYQFSGNFYYHLNGTWHIAVTVPSDVNQLTDTSGLFTGVPTTAGALETLMDAGQLVPGRSYIITDFAQAYNIFDGGTMNIEEEKIGTAEVLFVTAVSTTKLHHEARSAMRPQDIIHFSLKLLDDRDIGFGDGAGTPCANFKGMIYYRKDTVQNNYCHYSFVPDYGVKFRRWAVNAELYEDGVYANYTGHIDGMTTDITLTADVIGVIGNSISLLGDGVKTVAVLVSDWNTANPANEVVFTAGDDTQVPSDGFYMTLSYGVDPIAYVAKDVCKSGVDGKIYKCITATTGEGDPTVNTTDWVLWLDITADAFVSWTSDKTQFNIGDITTDNLIINNVTAGVDYDDFYTFGDYYEYCFNATIEKINLGLVEDTIGYLSTLNNIVAKTFEDVNANVYLHIQLNSMLGTICGFGSLKIICIGGLYSSKYIITGYRTEVWIESVIINSSQTYIKWNTILRNAVINYSFDPETSYTIYQDKTDGVKLSYMDGGVMQIVDVTA